jgi:phenylacetate-coenzyme A ligase PaaK-like adenylate-forming protein
MTFADIARLIRHRGPLLRRDGWSRQRLLAHQACALAALRTFTYARSPFYQKFHAGLMDRPLEDLPVLTKAELMRNFDDVVTDRAIRLGDVEEHLARTGGAERFAGRYTISASSGSTGQRGFFLFDPSEWGMLLATYGRPAWWAGLNFRLIHLIHPLRVAGFSSPVPWHQTAQVGASTTSRLAPSLRLDGTRPVAEVVEPLNQWKPDLLTTYASLARALAEEQLAGRLQIAPRMIGVGGEVLTREARNRIEEAWGKVLYDQYGASETGILAAECDRHAGLHLFEDLTVVEVVDADGRPVRPGDFGERVLVTVLFRHTQPLIRYELSDKVRMAAEPCPCGRPFRVIDAVQGRVEETLYFPTAAAGRVAIDPVVFEAVLDTVPATQWQVVQEPASLDILLTGLAADFRDEAIAEPLRRELASRGAAAPEIRVRRVAAIPRGATGKAPLIRRQVPPPLGAR